MKTTPLDAPFGALLHLETDAALREDGRDELRRLFTQHGLLVVREGRLPADRQIELLSALGRVEPDLQGRPMQMEVTNQHAQSTAPDGELVFHFDYAYDPMPIPAISMYGLVIAEGATPTLFASSATVLERLPPPLVDMLRSREAAHACFLNRPDRPGERSIEPEPVIARGEAGWGPDHYWAHHPVIGRNPAGVETLFVCLQHTDRILGMPREESDAILAELYAALYDPAHVYEHAWRRDDLVLWDNLSVQHARPEPNDLPRTLRRFHVSDSDLTEDYVRVAREHGFM
jgi:alpha-ketoglutarate-dependent taurine dioxygenase